MYIACIKLYIDYFKRKVNIIEKMMKKSMSKASLL